MAEMSDRWLEGQLLRQMAPVKAPDSLWTRIQAEQRSRKSVPRRGWMLWPALATLMLLASGDLLWEIGKARGSMLSLSDSELAGISRIDSENPAEIREWVKGRTNMDVDLNCGRPDGIRLAGARLIRFQDKLVAAISYRFEGKPGLMLVSQRGVVFQRAGVADGRLASWSAGNQSFTLTSPAARELEASCVRCHLEGHKQL